MSLRLVATWLRHQQWQLPSPWIPHGAVEWRTLRSILHFYRGYQLTLPSRSGHRYYFPTPKWIKRKRLRKFLLEAIRSRVMAEQNFHIAPIIPGIQITKK